MSLNLQKINNDEFFSNLVEILNQNFEIISNANGGAEGKQGQPGITGLAGPRGARGEQGVQGVRGTKWHTTVSSFPTSNIQIGDYCIITTNGKFYEYISVGNWELRGTFNYDENITIDIEDDVYDYEYNKIEDSLKVLINSKTNQSLLLTNYDRPDEDLGIQIPLYDEAGDSYPLIQGDDSDYKYLTDYKLKIFTSANSDIDEQQSIGKHIHLANSFSMKLKNLWRRSSGFTIDVELDTDSINETNDGVEILRISAVSSGEAHLHKVEVEGSDFNVGDIRLRKDGKVSIGYPESTETSEVLEINGGINVGYTNIAKAGTVRYSNGRYQGYDVATETWKNLDLSEEDILSLYSSNVTAFYDKIIDFGNVGGLILGDSSAQSPLKKGLIRFNNDLNIFEGWNGVKWVRLSNEVKLNEDGDIVIEDGTDDENPAHVSTLISVSTEQGDTGDAIYKGIIFTSPNETLSIQQNIFDSQYSVIELDVNGSINTPDDNGDTVAVSSIDIVSEDIKVKKSIIDGAVEFDLSFNGSEQFKQAIAETLDIRSSDGTVIAEPPSADKVYWDVRVNPNAVSIGDGVGSSAVEQVVNNLDKFKNVSLRYTQASKTKALEYSATFLGYYTYLPFETKDFDENCNIESTNPLVVSVKEGNAGYFHIDSRVRFSISTIPTGTFASIKLVVLKNSSIISTLCKLTSDDVQSSTVSTSKYFELAGSDILDFSCDSDDCSNTFKLAIITDYGTTNSSGNVSIQDAYISVHKTTAVTQNKINEFIGSSNVAYKTAIIKDSTGNATGNLTAQSLSGNLTLKEGTYTNISIESSNTIVIEANIDAIANEIVVSQGINRYANVIVGNVTVESTTDRSNIKLIGGDNVELSVTSTDENVEVTINSVTQSSSYYSDTELVSENFTGNLIFSNGFTVSESNGNVLIGLGESTTPITLPSIKVFREYPQGSKTQSGFLASDYYNGLVKFSEFSSNSNKFLGILLNDNVEDVIFADNDNFFLETGYDGYQHGVCPKFTGKCRVSSTVYYDLVYLDENHTTFPFTPFLERPFVGYYMLKANDGGSYQMVHNSGTMNTDLIHHIGSKDSQIKITKEFKQSQEFYNNTSMQSLTGSFDVEVEEDERYFFGLGTTAINYIRFDFSNVKNPDSGQGNSSQLMLVVYKADINFERIE